jgi:uncharacterized GH25 family protein
VKRPTRFAVATASLTIAIALFTALDLSAHDTWLFPKRTHYAVGSRLTLDLTSGMAFPKNEFAIDPARVETAAIRLGGRTAAMTRKVLSKQFLRLETTLSRNGVATVWISLKPKTLELTPPQIQEYLEEIGAPDSIRAIYPAGKSSNPRWREEYRKEAKTFVFVGASESDTSWKTPAGTSFEIVPVSDPARLVAGQSALFRVLRDGKPLSNFPIGSVTEARTKPQLDRSDANGVVRIIPPAAGRWMLRGTDLRRPAAGKNADWESVFATLTLTVGQK